MKNKYDIAGNFLLLSIVVLNIATFVSAAIVNAAETEFTDPSVNHFEIEIADGDIQLSHQHKNMQGDVVQNVITKYYFIPAEDAADQNPEDLLKAFAELMWIKSPLATRDLDNDMSRGLEEREVEMVSHLLTNTRLSDSEAERTFRREYYAEAGVTEEELESGLVEVYEMIVKNLSEIEPDEPGPENDKKEAEELYDAFVIMSETIPSGFDSINYTEAVAKNLITEEQRKSLQAFDLALGSGKITKIYEEELAEYEERLAHGQSPNSFLSVEEQLEDYIANALAFERIHQQQLINSEYDFDRSQSDYQEAVEFLKQKKNSMEVSDPEQALRKLLGDSTASTSIVAENSFEASSNGLFTQISDLIQQIKKLLGFLGS